MAFFLQKQLGVVHYWEELPIEKSFILIERNVNAVAFQDGPSAFAISITQQFKHLFQLIDGPQ